MQQSLENRFFLLLLAAVSAAFTLLLMPFWGAIFWALAISILFFPVYTWLLDKLNNRRSIAALLTVTLSVLIIIVPLTLISLQLYSEARALIEAFEEGDVDLQEIVQNIGDNFPFVNDILDWADIEVDNLGEHISEAASASSQFLAGSALRLSIGFGIFLLSMLLMVYLAFFLLRDGKWLSRVIAKAIPMGRGRENLLIERFVKVTRATIKGSVIVAVIEGILGGIIFAILGLPGPVLWGIVMGILSLIPALGAFVVWIPVAIYLLATGEWLDATILTVYGTLVIGLLDNFLRPILMGRDLRLPDYVVLFSLLGGIVIFGVHGLVIGPLLAALFVTLWGIFASDFDKDEQA